MFLKCIHFLREGQLFHVPLAKLGLVPAAEQGELHQPVVIAHAILNLHVSKFLGLCTCRVTLENV